MRPAELPAARRNRRKRRRLQRSAIPVQAVVRHVVRAANVYVGPESVRTLLIHQFPLQLFVPQTPDTSFLHINCQPVKRTLKCAITAYSRWHLLLLGHIIHRPNGKQFVSEPRNILGKKTDAPIAPTEPRKRSAPSNPYRFLKNFAIIRR